MNKNIITYLLAHNTLPSDVKTSIEQNPKAFEVWLEMFDDKISSSKGSFQLNKFHEVSQKFERNATPNLGQPIKAPHIEISKTMEIGKEFIQHAHKMSQDLLTINQPNSLFHVLEDGKVMLIIDTFLLGESDFFHVLCKQRKNHVSRDVTSILQQKDTYNLDTTTIEQLHQLGYIEDVNKQKCMFFDSQGNGKTIECLVLTPQVAQYLFGKDIYSLTSSPYLLPLLTVQVSLTKKLQKGFLDSEEPISVK